MRGPLLIPGLEGEGGGGLPRGAANLGGRLGGGGVVAEVRGVGEGQHGHPGLVAAVGRGYRSQLRPGQMMLGTLQEGRAPGMQVPDIPSLGG